uniref:Reverse transcriptase domain-containing protein n=1 Tax=Xenopus tropicalis TaxID=8364 RepID=A0A803JAB7_XENTR
MATTTTIIQDIKILSWNVGGLNSPLKRRKVLDRLKKEKPHIVLLQETHWRTKDKPSLKDNWVGECLEASYKKKIRGVATIFNKTLNYKTLKTYKDKQGRFLLLQIEIANIKYTIANIYAPNDNNQPFFTDLMQRLDSWEAAHIVFGGDMNVTWDRLLDNSGTAPTQTTDKAKHLKTLCKHIDIYDSFRYMNPTSKDYTFYSGVHKTFSRIDYIFTSQSLLPHIQKAEIKDIIISDHAPISLHIQNPQPQPRSFNWRFPSYLSHSEDFKQYVKTSLANYIDDNLTHWDNPNLLWAAAKPVLRGQITAYLAYRRKQFNIKYMTLQQELSQAYKQLKNHNNKETQNKYKEIKNLFDTLLTEKAQLSLDYKRNKYFRWGNKTGKLLASITKKQNLQPHIHKLQGKQGWITDTKKITEEMTQYFQSFYDLEQDNPTEGIKFLQEAHLTKLTIEERNLLNAPVTETDIQTTIKKLKSGKSPGPDGLSAEFYKILAPELTPLLLDLYNNTLQGLPLWPEANEARIILLPKKDRDPTNPQSYRPISLLNQDLKILTKIMADRLQQILPRILSPCQLGFTKGRHSVKATQQILALIYQHNIEKRKHGILVNLDAEKAFDRIFHAHLLRILKFQHFGHQLLKLFRALYSTPTAFLTINNLNSDRFYIKKGTRQGCPLSPLLFNLALDPLLRHLRQNPLFQGFKTKHLCHKIVAFADDILLFIGNPKQDIPIILETINRYTTFTGLKINYDKSEAIKLRHTATSDWTHNFPFKKAQHHITYLGVKFTDHHADTYKLNITQTILDLQHELNKWKTASLTFLGRAYLIKMIYFPMLLYKIQMLPYYLKQKDLKLANKIFREFIWTNKRPRIAMYKLQQTKTNGGINFPNLYNYNVAALLRHVGDWTYNTNTYSNLELEHTLMEATNLNFLLHLPPNELTTNQKNNPLFIHTYKAWHTIRHKHKTTKNLSLYLPWTGNTNFPSGLMTNVFAKWKQEGLHCIRDILNKKLSLMTFTEATTKFPFLQTQHFHFIQATHYAREVLRQLTEQDLTSPVNHIWKGANTHHSTASIHRLIRLNPNDTHKDTSLRKWTNTIPNADEQHILKLHLHAMRLTPSSQYQIMTLQLLHQSYLTPSRRFKMGQLDNPKCLRCKKDEGSLTHCIWQCPIIQPLWMQIHEYWNQLTKKKFIPDIEWALFSKINGGRQITKSDRALAGKLAAATRKAILQSHHHP